LLPKSAILIYIGHINIFLRINVYINVEIIFGDFNSLIFEVTQLLVVHFVRRGTALSTRGTCRHCKLLSTSACLTDVRYYS